MAAVTAEYSKLLKHMFPSIEHELIHNVIREVQQDDGDEDPNDFQYDRMVSILLSLHVEPESIDAYTVAERCQKIYEIFPNANKERVKSLVARNIPLSKIKEIIADNNGGMADVDMMDAGSSNLSKEKDIFIKLQDMLPRYDPDFLREQAQQLAFKTEDEISVIIEDLLSRKEFPTIEEFKVREQNRKMCESYTTNFTIEEFLAEFPDVDNKFEKLNRKHSLQNKVADYLAGNEDDALKYIKMLLYNHYSFLKVKTIDIYLNVCKWDIVKTCNKLDKLQKEFLTKRAALPEFMHISKNELMYHELAFAIHRNEIRAYLKQKNETYQEAWRLASDANVLVSCECCFAEEIPTECVCCVNGCKFCKDCVKLGVETMIADGKLEFPCFKDKCQGEFSLRTLKMVLRPIVFYCLENRIQNENLKRAQVEGYVECPFCPSGQVLPRQAIVLKCKDCGKESCRKCKYESHIPLRCNEIEFDEDVKMRTKIEENMTNALLRVCKYCKRQFIKESGCNKMTCTCGKTMCYLCGATDITYQHFEGNSPCHLLTDQEALHRANVLKGARQAKQELGIDKNPEKLKFDPTKNF